MEDGVTRISTEYHGDHASVKSHSALEMEFLADPDTVHDVLELAMQLHKQKHTAPGAMTATR